MHEYFQNILQNIAGCADSLRQLGFLCHSRLCVALYSTMFAAVVLLILTSQPIDALTMLGDGRQSREVHGSPPTYIEWTILVYVIGRETVTINRPVASQLLSADDGAYG